MSNEIVLRPVPDNDATLAPLKERMAYVQALTACTLIAPELRNPANGLMILDYGMALGISAMQAFTSINIIKGKPSTSPALMSAVVRRAGHRLRIVQTDSPLSVTATLVRADDPDFEFKVTWDLEKAQRAGLYPGRPGSGWDRYPDQMLRARAISEVCRQGAEDALAGVTYTPEELLTEPAPTVRVVPEPSPATAPTPAPEPAPVSTPTGVGTEYTTAPEPVEDATTRDEDDSRDQIKAFVCHAEGWTEGQWEEYVSWFAGRHGVATRDMHVLDDERWAAFVEHLFARPNVANATAEGRQD